jgi:arabinose-5-phosphate isomerase
MGDALAVALSAIKGFQPEDFARFHPGGSLGRKLLTRVADVMRHDDLPVCAPHTAFREVVHTINHGRLGLVLVVQDGALVGIVTDGDVRRAFDRFEDRFEALREVSAADIMTRQPKTIAPDIKLADAEAQMQERKIGALVVTGADGAVQGVLQIYDI